MGDGLNLAAAGALLVVFLITRWPRDVATLTGAGVLLTSRRMHSRRTLGLVDWELLVLFTGLFVVNNATESTGLPSVADHLAGPCGSRRPPPLGSEPNAYTADAVKVSC